MTERFVAAVRRRMAVVRLAESIGISLAAASGAGILIVGILWWRGMDAMRAIEAIWGLGLFVGIVWGVSRRPTRMEAACEADRQLDLHDLLGTVMAMRRADPSKWHEALVMFAEERCGALNPSAVIVNRMGMRGWAGVGVLGLLVMSVGMLAGRPSAVTAAPAAADGLRDDLAAGSRADVLVFEKGVDRPPGPGGTDDDRARGFANAKNEENAGQDSGNDGKSGSNAGTGGGMAISPPPMSAAMNRDGSAAGTSSQMGFARTGTGEGDVRATVPGENSSSIAAPTAGLHIAPWSAAGWESDRTAAEDAIGAGEVPQGDADLVRDYFRRD